MTHNFYYLSLAFTSLFRCIIWDLSRTVGLLPESFNVERRRGVNVGLDARVQGMVMQVTCTANTSSDYLIPLRALAFDPISARTIVDCAQIPS
jgi:hypothetical protein